MTLLERIHAAQSRQDLNFLEIEIILDMAHSKENQAAFIKKCGELINNEDGRKTK